MTRNNKWKLEDKKERGSLKKLQVIYQNNNYFIILANMAIAFKTNLTILNAAGTNNCIFILSNLQNMSHFLQTCLMNLDTSLKLWFD